jgi:hypothetical protein
VRDYKIAVVKRVHFSVGRVFSLGIDYYKLTFFDKLGAFVHKAHIFSLSVRFYRAEEFHTEARYAAFEGMLGRHGVELAGKDYKAGQNVVKKVEMIGNYKPSALEGGFAFLAFIICLALEEQKLERVT